MKKLLAALIFAGFGLAIAQDAPQPPADKPAPPKNEQGDRPGRPGGPDALAAVSILNASKPT